MYDCKVNIYFVMVGNLIIFGYNFLVFLDSREFDLVYLMFLFKVIVFCLFLFLIEL